MRWSKGIGRAVRALLIIFFIALLFFPSFAEDSGAQKFQQAQSTGASMGGFAKERLGSRNAVRDRIFTPMTSGGQVKMQTLDNSKQFAASLTEGSGNKLLDVFIQPGGDGLQLVKVYQDTNNDGKYDYEYTATNYMGDVSGICANGLIHCDPGTWDNCKYYMWTADSSGRVSIVQKSSINFGGCYCINSSCGYQLAANNLPIILKNIGGGVIGAIEQSGGYRVVVTGVREDSTNIVFYGEMEKVNNYPQQSDYTGNSDDSPQYEWETGADVPSQYWKGKDAGSFIAASGDIKEEEKNNPNSMYNLIVNSSAAKKQPYEEHTCYIKRTVTWNQTGNDGTQSGTLGQIGDNYIQNGQLYSKSYSFYIDNLDEVKSATLDSVNYDDTIEVLVNGQIIWEDWPCGTLGKTCCERSTNWRRSVDISFKRFLQKGNNTLSFVVCAMSNHGSGAGEGWITYTIQYKPYYHPSFQIDDECTEYENNSNCKLKDEWVDSVRTWRDYSPTGLTPVGQNCKTFPEYSSQAYCFDWWTKKRVYSCKLNSWDFSKAKQRMRTIINSTKNVNVMQTTPIGNINYQDYNNSSGSWQNYNNSMNVPFAGSKRGCMYVCKIKVPVQDTQAYANKNTSQYITTIHSYIFDYRKCEETGSGGYTCPVNTSKGETVVKDCQCINEFAEAATIMQMLENMGKDIICSKE